MFKEIKYWVFLKTFAGTDLNKLFEQILVTRKAKIEDCRSSSARQTNRNYGSERCEQEKQYRTEDLNASIHLAYVLLFRFQ